MRALLVGAPPPLQYEFVEADYQAVVLGSLSLNQALGNYPEAMLQALAQGMTVVAYEPGFPRADRNRALGASLASAKRQLKNCWRKWVGKKTALTCSSLSRLLVTIIPLLLPHVYCKTA